MHKPVHKSKKSSTNVTKQRRDIKKCQNLRLQPWEAKIESEQKNQSINQSIKVLQSEWIQLKKIWKKYYNQIICKNEPSIKLSKCIVECMILTSIYEQCLRSNW